MARAKTTKKKTIAKKAAAKKSPKKAVAKKVVAKKATSKKSVAKKATQRIAKKAAKKKTVKKDSKPTKVKVYNLSKPVSEDKYFVLANGKPVKHVAELAEALDDLEDHVFNHHVNPEKNDFHNWVKDVFEDLQLAKKMLGVSDKKHLQLVIYKHAAKKVLKR